MSYFTDIDDCVSNDCANGATCVDDTNQYSCTCAEEFTGKLCESGKRGLDKYYIYFYVARQERDHYNQTHLISILIYDIFQNGCPFKIILYACKFASLTSFLNKNYFELSTQKRG